MRNWLVVVKNSCGPCPEYPFWGNISNCSFDTFNEAKDEAERRVKMSPVDHAVAEVKVVYKRSPIITSEVLDNKK